jgi:Flp pilus assembly protein TadD
MIQLSRRASLILLVAITDGFSDTDRSAYLGSQACAPCHKAEYQQFLSTPMARSMARSSRVNTPEFDKPVQFLHLKTGRRYRIFRGGGDSLIEEFLTRRDGANVYTDLRRVAYTIGSGNHARSYLVRRSHTLYQAPVTFYTGTGRWDMSPGYDTSVPVGFTRRITANCLFCHAGRTKGWNAQGERFDTPDPFAEVAIGCERCHGPGRAHVATPGRAITNPVKLESELRDQVCEQCHLFGAARVVQPRRSLDNFRPGERLGDYVAIYDYQYASDQPTVTGHPNEMKISICRQRSNGKLWCGSCHLIHSPPPDTRKAAFYRERCWACHAKGDCTRGPERDSTASRENDCVSCHMPKRPVLESAHVTFTDHRILRRPQRQDTEAHEGTTLVRLLPRVLTDEAIRSRNLGFAYAQLASSTARRDFVRLAAEALQPLVTAKVADAELFENLGNSYVALEQIPRAEEAFRSAIALQPLSASAQYSLGYVLQAEGRTVEAIRAYEAALQADPEKAEALGNLAVAYASLDEKSKAMQAMQKALILEPGNLKWRALVAEWAARKPPVKDIR